MLVALHRTVRLPCSVDLACESSTIERCPSLDYAFVLFSRGHPVLTRRPSSARLGSLGSFTEPLFPLLAFSSQGKNGPYNGWDG